MMQIVLALIVIIQIVFISYIAWRIRYHAANPLYLVLFFLYKIIFAIIPVFASIDVNIGLSEMIGVNNISFILQEFLTVSGLFCLLVASRYSLSERVQIRRDVSFLTLALLLFGAFVFVPSLISDSVYTGLYGEYFQGNIAYWVTKLFVFLYGLVVHILVARNLMYYIVAERDSHMVMRWFIGLIVLSFSLMLSFSTTTYIVSVGLVGLNFVGSVVTVIGLIVLPLLFIFDFMFFYVPSFVHTWFIKNIFPYRDPFVYDRLNHIVKSLDGYGKPYISLDDNVTYSVKIPLAKNSILDLMGNAKNSDSHGERLYNLLQPCESMKSDAEQLFFLVRISPKVARVYTP